MYAKPVTLTEYILSQEKKIKDATGSFTLLMAHIEDAGKIIASHIKKTGLVDIIGEVGQKNSSDDEVKKIDTFSNSLLVETLRASTHVFAAASEEMEDFVNLNPDGEYVVFFDPLDGSSNVETHVTVGTIFSIYKKNDNLLQKGLEQVAAGYILYGTSVMFVYTFGKGVHGFTLDPAIGSFLLSHPNMTIPKKGAIYSINEGSSQLWESHVQRYISSLKEKDEEFGGPYKLRYIGSLVADMHRTFIKGGIFLYPKDKKNTEGKLRLMFEVNPFALLVKEAGGLALSGKENPLDITPSSLHQKTPAVMGSYDEVKRFIQLLS